VRLPATLPGRRANYVPPLWAEERAWHDPDKNPALQGVEMIRFMAYQGDRPVGRIVGLVHHVHNARNNERTARFHQLDAVDDVEVVRALLQAVEQWGKERGMDRVIGPFGLSDKDPQGLQVEGFEHLPVVATPTNPAYLPGAVEACGYAKYADCLSYRLLVPEKVPDRYARVAAHVLSGEDLRVVSFRSRREIERWIVPVLDLVNQTYTELLGFVPMSNAEMHKLAADYLPLLDPELVVIVADAKDVPMAFVVAVPDLSVGLQRARGRLFPFGFLHVLLAMRKAKQLDLLLGAVRKDVQGRGLTGALGVHLLGVARRRGFTTIDSHLVLETNASMRAQLERTGGEVYKRFRIYGKVLQPVVPRSV
jgi:GNAT superfamily N-acetyltransferase